MRRATLLLALISAPAALAAQASQFSIRGLGEPGREVSTRALALGGAFGLFDGESSINPAALATLTTVTALFTASGDYRTATNPQGTMSGRDTRFPQILVGGPIPHHPFAIGISYSLYADRDFTIASDGTASPRGVVVPVHDTLSSRGGVDDLRLGAAWVQGPHLSIGGAFHFLTGSNRLASRRYWEDTSYTSPQDLAELSYTGTGVSVGVMWQPVRSVQLAGSFRHDGLLTVQRDSTGSPPVPFATATIGVVPLPNTIDVALRVIPSPRLALSVSGISRNWSVADSSLVAQGSPGARNTVELNAGLELFRDVGRPLKYPLRLGARWATLPFELIDAPQPHEYGFSIGTGRRFAQDRGGFDITVEHLWRSQGSQYTESATVITFGISVRPGGVTP